MMYIPMDVPLDEQCIQFALAFLLGMLFGIGYCITRAVGRKTHPQIMDAVFAVVSLSLGTAFFLTVCRGYPRTYHLFGMTAGAALTWFLCGILRPPHRS